MYRWDGTSLKGHAINRRHTDRYGFFCEISLRLRAQGTQERRLEAIHVPPWLRGAVIFGIDYALDKVGYDGGWEAEVEYFGHHAVDSSPEVVAATTAQAILGALGVEVQPFVDVDRGVCVFPKCG